MRNNVKVAFFVLIILIIGLVLSVVLSRQTTQTRQNASQSVNINTAKDITQTKNKDQSMGPTSANGNYSNTLSKDALGSITFSITDPASGGPTFPAKIPTVTPKGQTGPGKISEGTKRVTSLIIKIKKIEVHLVSTKESINRFETLNLQTPMSVDLAQLTNGAVINFSLTKIAAGSYDEVRLYIESANATLEDGSNISLDVSAKNGIVRVMQNFTVTKGRNTNILIDFDAQKSVFYQNNKYLLKPFVVKLEVNK